MKRLQTQFCISLELSRKLENTLYKHKFLFTGYYTVYFNEPFFSNTFNPTQPTYEREKKEIKKTQRIYFFSVVLSKLFMLDDVVLVC